MKAYHFDEQGNSPEDGFNDPLKTIFGSRVEAVAREAFQNSTDAVLDPKQPVRVKVRLEHLKASQIPNSEQLTKIFKACSKNESAKGHFDNALKLLRSNKIPVLIISDYNTTGLTGADNDKKSKYYCFFKAVGGHNKTPGSAGSYGYGKATNIAFSAFDTFYATSLFLANNKPEHLFMGSIRVCTHTVDGVERRGVGSYGMKGQKPIRKKSEIPSFFLRREGVSETGTDIFIPAYRDAANWKENTIKSALKNFWPAILLRKLVVEIDDVLLNHKTLEDRINSYFPADSKGERWKFNNPRPYFEAYNNGKLTKLKLPSLGEIECRILPGGRTPTNHVACFRKNLMLIQHRKFDSIVPFTGVFICPDEIGNRVLQKMEPPEHNEWDPKAVHAQDDSGVPLKACTEADREYREFLRDEIRKLMSSRLSKRIELSTVDEFISLAGVSENSEGSDRAGEAKTAKHIKEGGLDTATPVIRTERAYRRFGRKFSALPGTGAEGALVSDGPGDQYGGGASSGGGGEGQGSGTSANSGGGEITAKLAKIRLRSFAIRENDVLKTRLIIRTTPRRPRAKLKVFLKAGTDDGFEALTPSSVFPQGTIMNDGSIEGVVTDDSGELLIDVTFPNNERYSLKAEVHETR